MKSKIKYISFYNHVDSEFNRASALSAVNKINYVIDTLNELDYDVELISPSWLTKDNNVNYVKYIKENIGRNLFVYTPSFRPVNKFFSTFNVILSILWLILYLIFNCKKNEKVIVYHSPLLIIPISIVKKIKGLDIILEIEEIYHEVWSNNKQFRFFKEIEYSFLQKTKKAIVASDNIQNKLNLDDLNTIKLYGAYRVNNHKTKDNYNNNIIEVVYAGGIEKTRSGAFNSIELISFLPSNYRLNILGYGSEDCIDELLQKIDLYNEKLDNKIIFHGTLHGNDLINFLNKCHIGLNPQNLGDYMDSAFPSKILTYISNGLNVISSDIEVIRKSQISDYIFFYQNMEDVSSFQYKNYDYNIVKVLHMNFLNHLKLLLNDH